VAVAVAVAVAGLVVAVQGRVGTGRHQWGKRDAGLHLRQATPAPVATFMTGITTAAALHAAAAAVAADLRLTAVAGLGCPADHVTCVDLTTAVLVRLEMGHVTRVTCVDLTTEVVVCLEMGHVMTS
jgi:hypothetical protein